MRNVAVEVLEVSLHGRLDVRRKMMGAFGGMKDLVALFEQRSKCGMTHLEPSFTLALVVGGSEGSCLQYELLVAVIVHVRGCQGKQMLVVNHSSMLIGQVFWPVNGAFRDSAGFVLDRC